MLKLVISYFKVLIVFSNQESVASQLFLQLKNSLHGSIGMDGVGFSNDIALSSFDSLKHLTLLFN